MKRKSWIKRYACAYVSRHCAQTWMKLSVLWPISWCSRGQEVLCPSNLPRWKCLSHSSSVLPVLRCSFSV